MATTTTAKQEVFDYVNLSLGGGMVDVELDQAHYEEALKKSFAKFRQRSDNSVEESYLFLPTVIDQNTYTLPEEVIEVRKIFRRIKGEVMTFACGVGMYFYNMFCVLIIMFWVPGPQNC